MERLQHPDITATERTGYPRRHAPKVYCRCDWCDGEIRYGDEYFNIHGEILCFDCGTDCLKRAGDDDG